MTMNTAHSTIIPKIIHYCWFGGNPLPPLAKKCIASWKKYLPDYEIRQWDESNYDVNKIPYIKEAYAAKKFAFVSDYARFDILYNYGGIYFDTDVEIISPLDCIISAGSFMGCENKATPGATPNLLGVAPGLGLRVNPGLGLGVTPGLGLIREILDNYSTLHFKRPDGSLNQTTIVKYTTEILCKHGLVNTPDIHTVAGINIYPCEYFCPLDYNTGNLIITKNTVSIHHYTASWKTKSDTIKQFIAKLLGKRITTLLISVRRHIKL